MKLLRYKSDNEESSWGVLNDDNLIQNLMGNPLGDFEIGSKLFDFSELHLLPPCEPKQVIAAAKNYLGVTDAEKIWKNHYSS